MTQAEQTNPSTTCKVCGVVSEFLDEAEILGSYRASYFRCRGCGFIQTETPYWLEEAYSSAIACQDVGIMHRNLVNQELTAAVLNLLLPEVRTAVDYGAGHGIFVRLMRDKGFDFRWYDRHATNDYARGFEYVNAQRYDFLTAFEVLEHLTDPVNDLGEMMSIADNVFVSTLLVPEPAPRIADWWYYMASSGQHLSFYTRKSLEELAKRFGRHLLSNGSHHLFTREPKSGLRFRLAASFRSSRILNRLYKRPSLIGADLRATIK